MSLPTFDRIVREKWEEWRDEVLSKARGEDMIRTGRLYDAKGGYTEAERVPLFSSHGLADQEQGLHQRRQSHHSAALFGRLQFLFDGPDG